MQLKGKHNNDFVKKPEFIEIYNIYDNLEKLVDEYGISKVLMHLGQIANKKISRQFASKIWTLVSTPEPSNEKD